MNQECQRCGLSANEQLTIETRAENHCDPVPTTTHYLCSRCSARFQARFQSVLARFLEQDDDEYRDDGYNDVYNDYFRCGC